MSPRRTKITITHELDLDYPERETGHVIAHSDWTRLKKRIIRIRLYGATFMNIGCLLLGIGATALFVAITLDVTDGVKHTTCWIVAVTSLIVGSLLVLFHYIYKRNQEEFSVGDIKDCLKEIEDKFPKHDTSSSQE